MYPTGLQPRPVMTLSGIIEEKQRVARPSGKRVGGGVATERVGINVPIAGDGRPSWGAWSEPLPEREATAGEPDAPTGA